MGIARGNNEYKNIGDITLGNKKVLEVYRGNDLIWPLSQWEEIDTPNYTFSDVIWDGDWILCGTKIVSEIQHGVVVRYDGVSFTELYLWGAQTVARAIEQDPFTDQYIVLLQSDVDSLSIYSAVNPTSFSLQYTRTGTYSIENEIDRNNLSGSSGVWMIPISGSMVMRSSGSLSSWNTVSVSNASYIAYGENRFVVSGGGFSWTAYSADQSGSSFSDSLPPDDWGGGSIRGIAYGNEVFIAVSSTTSVARSSSIGILWIEVGSLPSGSDARKVRFENGMFYAIGQNGLIAKSETGLEWELEDMGQSNKHIREICGDGSEGLLALSEYGNQSIFIKT